MWFTEGGFANPENIRYAESADGDNWTISPTVILQDHKRPNIYRENGNYWLFATTDNAQSVELYRSSSELIQSSDFVATVLSVGSSGWDSANIGNHTVWKEGGTYYMIYDAIDGTVWRMGEATSPDGVTWTKSGDNPTITGSTIGKSGMVGGPDMHVIGSEYYLWFHLSESSNTPTDGGVIKTTDLRNWSTPPNRTLPTVPRTENWEGVGQPDAQIADLCVVSHPDLAETHLFYAGSDAQAVGSFNIGHATAPQSRPNIFSYDP